MNEEDNVRYIKRTKILLDSAGKEYTQMLNLLIDLTQPFFNGYSKIDKKNMDKKRIYFSVIISNLICDVAYDADEAFHILELIRKNLEYFDRVVSK